MIKLEGRNPWHDDDELFSIACSSLFSTPRTLLLALTLFILTSLDFDYFPVLYNTNFEC